MPEDTVITIHSCDEHDHVVVFVNDEQVISNDYSIENMYRLCKYLGFTIKDIEHTGDEFEELFA